jgi:TonB family protein
LFAAGTSRPLQDPVTRLAPAPTTQALATPAATKPAARVASPDPLAPRFANSDELRLRELATQQALANLRAGRPAPAAITSAPTPAIAGTVVRPSGSSPARATSLQDPAVAAALAAPADELGRIRVVDPIYPADAMRGRVEGWVELEFTITETGTVRDVVVVGSQPQGVFDDAATEAVSAWKYRPRIANGQPVPRRSSVTLRFNVDG